jgi:hypothetical protein
MVALPTLAQVLAATPSVARPDLTVVRDYLRVPATSLSDVDLQRIMDAAGDAQDKRCTMPTDGTYPAALEQAWLRRIQREVAARNLPLGLVGLESEYGPESLPGWDALVAEAERPYRTQVLG